MVILFLLFLIQFSVACACLGVNREQQDQLAEQGWQRVDNSTRTNVQEVFGCCGFDPKVDLKVPPPSCEVIWVRTYIYEWFMIKGSLSLYEKFLKMVLLYVFCFHGFWFNSVITLFHPPDQIFKI